MSFRKPLSKLYLLLKIHKWIQKMGKPIISNCGSPTEKVSEFLDFHLKPIMRNSNSCIRDSSHFQQKIEKHSRNAR